MASYDDIINLPHPVSKRHKQMTMYQRAAQFAPFAALVGHSSAINDTAQQNLENFTAPTPDYDPTLPDEDICLSSYNFD